MFLLAERWGGAIDRLRGAATVSALGAGLFVLFALSLLGLAAIAAAVATQQPGARVVDIVEAP